MADLFLIRGNSNKKGTFGTIYSSEGLPICNSLELPWINNTPFISCVPGNIVYKMKRAVRHKGKKTERIVWELIDVPGGRDRCQLHPANYISQLQGCIAPATYWDMTAGGEVMGCRSGAALDDMEEFLEGREEASICIVNPGHNNFNVLDALTTAYRLNPSRI